MERKPITIYLDNLHKQNNNLYQTLNTPIKKFTIGVSSISQKNEDNKISNNWYYLYVQMHEYFRF